MPGEFALRIDAKVTFLMVIPMSFAGRTLLGPKRDTIRNIEIRVGGAFYPNACNRLSSTALK